MFEITDPQTFWVSATNIVLGLAALCCAALIASVVINELIERWVARMTPSSRGTEHEFHASGLGEREATGPEYWGF